jgi:hypothetical protein
VLVILGLLVGGIMTGQSLIRAAELRSVTSDLSRYESAVYAFRDKYSDLPGDMTNATVFWGDRATGTDACPDATIPNGNPGTCNATGNAIIDTGAEWWLFWQHLANAGLIEGTYTGVQGSAGNPFDADIGSNVPRSKMGNAGWTFFYHGQYAGDTYWWAAKWNHAGFFGGDSGNYQTHAGIMSPEEIWNIDTKMDDGKPASGKIWVQRWSQCTMATGNTDFNVDYRLNLTTKDCSIVFNNVF